MSLDGAQVFPNPVYSPCMIAKAGCFVVLAGMAVGCGASDGPPRAQVSAQIPLAADSPLALTAHAALVRAGAGFVLAGLDGNIVRWGRLSEDGLIVGESQFTLPEAPALMPDGRTLGPVFAVTQKVAPGDQLVAAMLVEKAGSPNTYEVVAFVHDQATSVAPSRHVLGDLVASAQSGTIRVVASSPPSGKTAVVLWGTGGQAAPLKYQVLGSDGVAVGDVQKLLDNPDPTKIPLWDCVDVTQSFDGVAITLVEDASADVPLPLWHRFDLDDQGSTRNDVSIYIRWGQVADCRITSSPTPVAGGYLAVWQNSKSSGGTYFAHMTPPPADAGFDEQPEVSSNPLLASERYGGYSRMPKLLWAAPIDTGFEFTVGMLSSKGPVVMGFNLFSDPKGKTLRLPSAAGRVGPVSSWVGADATWVTYLDMPVQARTAPATRLLVKVTPSPAK